jgi:hypothetical protein
MCIGVQKGGTSWLDRALRQHPGVWAGPLKELHYFDYRFLPEHRAWIRRGLKRELAAALAAARAAPVPDPAHIRHLKGLRVMPFRAGWYRRAFAAAPDDVQRIDITPEYCTLPEAGITFLRDLLPETRFVFVIRDPVERAISQVKMMVARRYTRRKRSLEYPDDDVWMEVARHRAIANRGDYQTYVPRWDRLVDSHRLLYLPFGRIRCAPHRLLAADEAFAGLEPGRYTGLDTAVHAAPYQAAPASVVDYLEGVLAPQRRFLQDRFGMPFAREIL